MLNLKQNSINEFIIYANTISSELEQFGDYFLVGFQNGFTSEWSYVVPTVLVRNKRFIKFQIEIVPTVALENLLNGVVYLSPSLNWDYKIWNTETPTTDPESLLLVDKGQMILDVQEVPEIPFTSYKSANENGKSFVYYTSNGIWNNTGQLFDYYQATWNKN